MWFKLPDWFEIKTSENIEAWIKNFWDIATNKYFSPRNAEFQYSERTWPNEKISEAPIWCSVDLRDWNQSLEKPMDTMRKLMGFKILVEMWYKEIEVWFPAADSNDFEFIRALIEHNLIPSDVSIQVLCQCREDLIEKTRLSLEWAKNAIVHIYNSTSEVQREIVFKHWEHENMEMALRGVDLVKKYFADFSWNMRFQYSPESFTWTEMKYAVDVCNAVIDSWGWQSIIINLPATVENTTPNVYADKVEFMKDSILKHTKWQTDVIISLHTHKDRGTWEAASELWLLAWATRVEWCNLDFWERSGNANLITLAMNLFSQWISPNLNLSNLLWKLEELSSITNTQIWDRQPYVWKWVHTAFSWSHQDAIRKWFNTQSTQWRWENPYLPIDPRDIWMAYEPIIVNSQSWKWWAAFIIEQAWYIIPKAMHSKIGLHIQKLSEDKWDALTNDEIIEEFKCIFINEDGPITLEWFHYDSDLEIWIYEQFVSHIKNTYMLELKTLWEGQQSMWEGKWAVSCAYSHIKIWEEEYFWIWVDSDIAKSPLKALVSALNNIIKIDADTEWV